MDYSLKDIQRMAGQDPRVKKALKRCSLSLIPLLLGIIFSSIGQTFIAYGLLLIGFPAFITFLLSTLVQQKKAREEIMARLQREEEDRLAKVKASMTPAEWQAYMLELENNRLLKELEQRSSQKSTTRTVFGYTEGG